MKRRVHLVLLVSIVLCVSAATMGVAGLAAPPPEAADDWSTDRGDARHTGSNDGAAPTGPNATVAWSQSTDHDDGPGEPTAPAVVNGTAYVGYYDIGDEGTFQSRGHVIAYDAVTGEVAWNQSDLPEVTTPPTAANGLVYVTSAADADECPAVCAPDPPDEQGGVYALNATTGEIVWNRTDTDPELTPWEGARDHVVADGRVYVNTHQGVYALDAETGETVWNQTVSGTLALSNDTLVVRGGTANETVVRGLAPDTGEIQWTTTLNETSTTVDLPIRTAREFPGVAAANGTAYLPVERDQLYAVALDDGAVQWNASLSGEYPNSTTDWISAAAVREGAVYVSTVDYDHNGTGEEFGTVHALDAATGETTWRFDTAAEVAEPSVANDTVYLGAYHPSVKSAQEASTADPGVYALDAASGEERWNYVLSASLTEQRFDAVTTAPAEGSLYVTQSNVLAYTQEGTVYALNSTTEAAGPEAQFADDSVEDELNVPPTVSIAVDPSNATAEPVPAGTNVTLTADAADDDGTITEIRWDIEGPVLDDDRTGESITVEVANCASYEVTVYVTDNDGATATETVTIDGACEDC